MQSGKQKPGCAGFKNQSCRGGTKIKQKPFLKAQLRSLLTIYCYGRGYLNFRVPALTINNQKTILRPSLRLRVLKRKRFKKIY